VDESPNAQSGVEEEEEEDTHKFSSGTQYLSNEFHDKNVLGFSQDFMT